MRGIRSAVRTRLISFGLYVGAVLVGAVTLPLLIIVPGWLVAVFPAAVQPIAQPFVTYGYWPAVAVVCTAAITALYHFAVPLRSSWRRDLPGAVAAMALWVSASYGLRTYLAYEIAHSPTYGALAAPVAALLFLYVTSLALLFGAELNAQIRYARKRTARPAPATGELPALPEQPAIPAVPAQPTPSASLMTGLNVASTPRLRD
jgi:membrane protein